MKSILSQNSIGTSTYFKNLEVTNKVISEKIVHKNMFLQMNDILIDETSSHQTILIDEINDGTLISFSFIIIMIIQDRSTKNKIEL